MGNRFILNRFGSTPKSGLRPRNEQHRPKDGIRTPLTLMLGPTSTRDELNLLHRNCMRLLKLVIEIALFAVTYFRV